jgi:hypothetical protein
MLDLMFGLPAKFAMAAGVFAVLAIVVWRIRRSGYRAALEKQRRADAKARETRDEIEEAVAGRTAEENRSRLWVR